ncbi:MAG TPA: DUF934 domain-containing protein [Burkholderiaceae bacterium]|nr:DUF934 domain-containing protein [Burkholderiaceae bacterium]
MSSKAIHFVDRATDPWRPPTEGAFAPAAHTLLTLDQWSLLGDRWPAALPVGVTIANTIDVETLIDQLPRWSMLALQFPKWTDGRAYSQARLLRSRLRYAGEVRATGEVLVDMAPLMQRNGFDAALLRADQSLDAARRALRFFVGHYQGDVRHSQPLFSRLEA